MCCACATAGSAWRPTMGSRQPTLTTPRRLCQWLGLRLLSKQQGRAERTTPGRRAECVFAGRLIARRVCPADAARNACHSRMSM